MICISSQIKAPVNIKIGKYGFERQRLHASLEMSLHFRVPVIFVLLSCFTICEILICTFVTSTIFKTIVVSVPLNYMIPINGK